MAGLTDLHGADEGAAPARSDVEGLAHAVEAGPLDLGILPGRRCDGHLKGGRDAEVDGVFAAARLVGLLIAELRLAGRQADGGLAGDVERGAVVCGPARAKDEEEDRAVDEEEGDDGGDDQPGGHVMSLWRDGAGEEEILGPRWRRSAAARPMSEHGRYDLIFDLGPRLLRVQCKWGNRKGGVVAANLGGNYLRPNGYVRSTYGADEIDA